MTETAKNILAEKLVGVTPSRTSSMIKGGGTGALMFVIFEFFSTINSNAPRIPVVWLLTVVTVLIEAVLFIRIIAPLRSPRSADLFFTLRLSYQQRIEIALHSLQRVHTAFTPFIITALICAAIGEGVVIGERSLLLLAVLPVTSALFLLCAEAAAQWLIRIHAVKPVTADVSGFNGTSGGSLFRKLVKGISLPFAKQLTKPVPKALRVMVMRNILYLMRGELFITLLLITLIPVAVSLVLMVLEGVDEAFVVFLPLLALFLVNQHVVSELSEASAVLPACYWYEYKNRNALAGFTVTLIVIGLPFVAAMTVLMIPHCTAMKGAVTLTNGFVAYLVLIFSAACRVLSHQKRIEKGGYDLAVFAILSIGIFVPFAGIVFTLAALGVELLQQWNVLKNDDTFSSVHDCC